MDIEEYRKTVRKMDELNEAMAARLERMREIQNERSPDNGLRLGNYLPQWIGDLKGNLDFDNLYNGMVDVKCNGHLRGEDFEYNIYLPVECFMAETAEEAFDVYVEMCQEEYRKEAERKACAEAKEKEKKNAETPVYECAHFEYEYDDLGKYRWCRNRESGRGECNCNYIYAQQFCPFYKKGKLRGKWLIGDAEIEAAKMFKEEWSKHGVS